MLEYALRVVAAMLRPLWWWINVHKVSWEISLDTGSQGLFLGFRPSGRARESQHKEKKLGK
jgi:hypothetical protein